MDIPTATWINDWQTQQQMPPKQLSFKERLANAFRIGIFPISIEWWRIFKYPYRYGTTTHLTVSLNLPYGAASRAFHDWLHSNLNGKTAYVWESSEDYSGTLYFKDLESLNNFVNAWGPAPLTSKY